MNKSELWRQAKFELVEKRPTWGTVTTFELSQILNIPMSTLGNWAVRNKLPAPEPRRRGLGNKNRYRISTIINWLMGAPEDEIHWKFIKEHMGEGFKSIEQAKWNAKHYPTAFGVEKA